ncbi:hypothetical protein ACMXYV_07570 [Neptuniibacter sp. SY11_33]|uniref:hypothetical protein n=1 Tax=Neptuniibacter sp. SY11_33 TaxID=3398215 RepID=UPI0039F4A65F
MTLSREEKENLLAIIEIIYGYDSQIKNYKSSFNAATVDVVEKALTALTKCNENMKALVVRIVGGAGRLAKGWLRKVLKATKRMLAREKVKFNGLACRNIAAANWKSAIIMSVY